MTAAPDPNRPTPPDDSWSEPQWHAYRVLHGGGTIRDAAAAVERSPGTVSKWVKGWRAEYGADLFRDDKPHPTGALAGRTVATRAEVSDRGRAAANAQQEPWRQLRGQVARRLGITADAARAKCLAAIQALDPAMMGAGDVYALAKTAQILAREADRLSGVDAPTSGAAGRTDAPPEPVDLDGFGELGHHDKAATVLQLIEQAAARKAQAIEATATDVP